MVEINRCTRKNLCADCDDPDCLFAGITEADCPKWKCDNPTMNCETCEFLKEYKKGARNEYRARNQNANRQDSGGDEGMNIYTLLALFAGIVIGANFGFIIASFMGANDDGTNMLDK